MRTANIVCISQEKTVCTSLYVDLIVKVFEENSEITQGVIEYQLRASKSGVCLNQNWTFVNRGEERVGVQTLHLFCGLHN